MEVSKQVLAIQDGREIEKDQNGLGVSDEGVAYTLDGTGAQSIFSSEASRDRAKTCPSPAEGKGSPVTDPGCSSSSHESLTLFSPMADGSSLRTYPDFFPPTADEISPSFSRRWPSSGFTTSPGECWTADTSECPNGGDGCSSLRDVLVGDVPARFFLSPRAAAGILRRAEKRGRELPRALAEALRALASAHPDDGRRTTRTSSPTDSPGGTPREPTPTPPTPSSTPSTEGEGEPTTTRPRPGTSSPLCLSENQRAEVLETPYARQLTGGGGKMGQGYPAMRQGSSVRRLTPTECERLQGMPDGWTVTTGPSLLSSAKTSGPRSGSPTTPASSPEVGASLDRDTPPSSEAA